METKSGLYDGTISDEHEIQGSRIKTRKYKNKSYSQKYVTKCNNCKTQINVQHDVKKSSAYNL